MLNFPEQNLRTPGPTPIPDDIVEAMSRPMINHRGPEFLELLTRVTGQLKQVFMTANDLYILTASGTGSLGFDCEHAVPRGQGLVGHRRSLR